MLQKKTEVEGRMGVSISPWLTVTFYMCVKVLLRSVVEVAFLITMKWVSSEHGFR